METRPHGKHSLVHGSSLAGSEGSAVKLFTSSNGCLILQGYIQSCLLCAWHVPLIFSFESLGFVSKACVILCALVLQEIVIVHTRT